MKIGSRISRSVLMSFLLLFFFFNNDMKPLANTMEKKTTINRKLSMLLENDPILNGAIAGISIRSDLTGEIIYEHLGSIRLKPASNLKLLTAAAALSVLGENYTFKTELLTDGPIVGNMIFGNLYVKGKGDPTLLKSDFDEFADKIIQKGINVIQGNLIADDSWYDDVQLSVDLPWSDEQTYYGAPISALTASPDKDYDAGSIIIDVSPSKRIGDRALYSISPKTDYLKVVNEAKTVQAEGKEDIEIIREHGTNTIRIKGNIPIKSNNKTEWISVSNPTGFALNLFKQSLEEKGIVINGKIKEKTVPKGAILLASHQSIPLKELMVPFMKLSNNVHAEILIKELGKVKKGIGSWDKGLDVLEEELVDLGMNTNTLVLRDGSGISHLNLVPVNELSKLLFLVQKEPWFKTFLFSLPISGEKEKMVGGTLRHRLKQPILKGKVRAKTGTLTTVSSLSGYVEAENGETMIISIILNNLIDEEKGKELEDRILTLLINS